MKFIDKITLFCFTCRNAVGIVEMMENNFINFLFLCAMLISNLEASVKLPEHNNKY